MFEKVSEVWVMSPLGCGRRVNESIILSRLLQELGDSLTTSSQAGRDKLVPR